MQMDKVYWDHCLDIAWALGASPYHVQRMPTIREWISSSPLSLEIKEKLRSLLSDRHLPKKIKSAFDKAEVKLNGDRLDYETVYSDMAHFIVGVLYWADTQRSKERRFRARTRTVLSDPELKVTVNAVHKILSLPKRLRELEVALAHNGLGELRLISTPNGLTMRLTTDAYERSSEFLLSATPHLRKILKHISNLPKRPVPTERRKDILFYLSVRLMAYWTTRTGNPQFGIVGHVLELCGLSSTTSALKQMKSLRR